LFRTSAGHHFNNLTIKGGISSVAALKESIEHTTLDTTSLRIKFAEQVRLTKALSSMHEEQTDEVLVNSSKYKVSSRDQAAGIVLSVCLSVCLLSVCLSICLSVFLSVCISLSRSRAFARALSLSHITLSLSLSLALSLSLSGSGSLIYIYLKPRLRNTFAH